MTGQPNLSYEDVFRPMPIQVGVRADISAATQLTMEMALEAGFPPNEREQIALAARELASNLIDHAGGGVLVLRQLLNEGVSGIEIESIDQGPGIAQENLCVVDGFTTKTGSLGYGLGTVIRLMDQFDIQKNPGGENGARIVCRRWLRPGKTYSTESPLEVGIATRPHPASSVNGDAFVSMSWGTSTLAGVIDGLGHGQLAYEAAQAARNYVETHYNRPLDELFVGVARVCRGTRGVVMALARFDWARPQLTFGAIGNIEVRVRGDSKSPAFVIRRGILGAMAPKAVITTSPWSFSSVMALHSDGLQSHWRWEDLPELWDMPASQIARGMLRRLGKDNDDATIVVVRSKPGV